MSDPYSEFGGSQSTPEPPPSTSDPYAEFGGTAEQQHATQQPPASQVPSAASRFWSGVQAGSGGENALNTQIDPEHPIASNPMIPGAGVYRDLKAGNIAGAAGRVAGPAAQLLPMILGGRGRVEVPPERVPLWKQAGIEPGAPPASVQTSSPEEIKAQLQRMASRPQPTAPYAAPSPTTQLTAEGQPVAPGQLPIAKGNPYAGPRIPQNMEVAQSTNIGLHGYHPDTQTMLVQFKNGRVYEYRGVPKEIYEQYQQSESQGSFFANNIKGRYETNFRGTVKPTPGAQVKQTLGR